MGVNNADRDDAVRHHRHAGSGRTIGGPDYVNFGWALTPQPEDDPEDGSTIQVLVDGVGDRPLLYNHYRPDVSSLFQGPEEHGGPGPPTGARWGSSAFDTRMLSDGLHTIAWTVVDDEARPRGSGSRFFEVRNGAVVGHGARGTSGERSGRPAARSPVAAVRCSSRVPAGRARRATRAHGSRRHPPRGRCAPSISPISKLGGRPGPGRRLSRGRRRIPPLPIGSTFDTEAGVFAWQLGPGFVGVYDLLFLRTVDGRRERIPVRMVVQPPTGASADRWSSSSPQATRRSTLPFTITGWAVSGAARQIRAVFVYAYPTDGSAPVFVGEGGVTAGAARHWGHPVWWAVCAGRVLGCRVRSAGRHV